MEVAMEGSNNPAAMTRASFVKGFLAMLRFHVPVAVRVPVGMNGHMQAEYDELTFCLSFTALSFKPCELLRGDEAIMRINMCIVQ